mmetsp:Transcript_43204/g.78598  ORF Transcript_43204/g.78598 Transcript_43204/m.78598 type:complete len:485 (-) Transcript_43204:64-1518(-)
MDMVRNLIWLVFHSLVTSLAVDGLVTSDAGQHFWDGTCGNHDLHFQGPWLAKNASSIRLVALSLVVRHGARNFLDDPRKACHTSSAGVPATGGLDEIPQSVSGVLEPPIEAHFDFESEADVPTLLEPPALTDKNRCKGCLLHNAIIEFRDLGSKIRSTYFPWMEQTPTLKNSWFYSTANDRNVESMYFLRRNLFPGEPEVEVPYFTRKVGTDPWAGHTDCPSAIDVFIRSNRTLPPMYAGFGKAWQRAAGAEFTWACHDPMIVAWCSSRWNEVLDLPMSRDSTIVQEAFGIYAEMYAARYMENQEANALMIAPAVFELVDMLRKQAVGQGSPLTVWSTQDVVIVSILVGLGLWDKVWPQYAEALLFELYHDAKNPQRVLFRLLRRGVPLAVCNSSVGPEGLCDLDMLIPASMLALRNNTRWREACTSRVEEPVEARVTVVISPWIALLPLVSVLIVLWVVCRCRRTTARSRSPLPGFSVPLLGG